MVVVVSCLDLPSASWLLLCLMPTKPGNPLIFLWRFMTILGESVSVPNFNTTKCRKAYGKWILVQVKKDHNKQQSKNRRSALPSPDLRPTSNWFQQIARRFEAFALKSTWSELAGVAHSEKWNSPFYTVWWLRGAGAKWTLGGRADMGTQHKMNKRNEASGSLQPIPNRRPIPHHSLITAI